jgi:hypothetical protein
LEKLDLTGLEVGGEVIYVDPVAVPHKALVTTVWGDPATCVPCINIAYVNPDKNAQDSYGRQISRQTSLQHRSVNPSHGQYYMLPGDVQNPVLAAFAK